MIYFIQYSATLRIVALRPLPLVFGISQYYPTNAPSPFPSLSSRLQFSAIFFLKRGISPYPVFASACTTRASSLLLAPWIIDWDHNHHQTRRPLDSAELRLAATVFVAFEYHGDRSCVLVYFDFRKLTSACYWKLHLGQNLLKKNIFGTST